jgi:hypothetical protein
MAGGDLRQRRATGEKENGEAASAAAKAGPSSGGGAEEAAEPGSPGGRKEALGWMEWGRGWLATVGEFFFQRIAASHLANPLELPPLDGVSVIVTGATSGIGLEIARSSFDCQQLQMGSSNCY